MQDTAVDSITVETLPEAAFSATPKVGALPLEVQFTDESLPGSALAGITQWHWDFGDGNTNTNTLGNEGENEGEGETGPNNGDVSHIYQMHGRYDVSLTVTTAVGVDTMEKRRFITVHQLAALDFSGEPRTGVEQLNVSFDAVSVVGLENISEWAWDFGDGTASTETVPSTTHCYTQPGVYTVILKAVANGETYTKTKRNYVRVRGSALTPQPEGSFGETYEDLIPDDSVVEEYDPDRFAVIMGQVIDTEDTPLNGVLVSIHGKPQYGSVITGYDEDKDSSGWFTLPVEGGGFCNVLYEMEGYTSIQRRVRVRWNDVTLAETVRMLQPEVGTDVVFSETVSVVTHTSSLVENIGDEPSRACSVILTGDNLPFEVDEDGNKLRSMQQFRIRTTEYTTPDSMPGTLPGPTAYTYCVEMTVDGAENVVFDRPVVVYTDNFLNFPVGEVVPVGSYDRRRGAWVAEHNGVVVQILDTDNDGIVDAIDTGEGEFETDVTGLEDGDRFEPGNTYMRFQANHFSSWDCNWGRGFPGGAGPPTPSGYSGGGTGRSPDSTKTGCYVTNQDRVFHDDLPLPGTNFALHYASNAVPAYQSLTLWVDPGMDDFDSEADPMKRLEVTVYCGGERQVQVFEPSSAMPEYVEFTLGRQHFSKRRVKDTVNANVSVSKIYDAVMLRDGGVSPFAFGKPGSDFEIVGSRTRDEIGMYCTYQTPLLLTHHPGSVARGWTLTNHHFKPSPKSDYILRGDGRISPVTPRLSHLQAPVPLSRSGLETMNSGMNVRYLTSDNQGNLYFRDADSNRVRRIDKSGGIEIIAGSGLWGAGGWGDGGLAVNARFRFIKDIVTDSEGNVYISDFNDARIRRVDRNGIISTYAGCVEPDVYGGCPPICGNSGNYECRDSSAVKTFIMPAAMAIDRFDNLYFINSNDGPDFGHGEEGIFCIGLSALLK